MEHTNVGKICMHVEIDDVLNHGESHEAVLVVSTETADHWILKENFMWIGSDRADIPKIQHGEVHLLSERFPHSDRNIRRPHKHEFRIPLEDVTAGAMSVPYYVALHPIIVQGESKPKTPRTDNLHSSYLRQPSTAEMRQNENDEIISTNKGGIWLTEFILNFMLPETSAPSSKTFSIPELTNMQQERRLYEFSRREPNAACFSTPSMDIGRSIGNTPTSDLFTEDFLFQFHIASVLASGVVYEANLMEKIDYYKTLYERFAAFDDGLNDVALVAKVEDVCYGVFRGTVESNLADVAQNFIYGFRQVPGTTCYVRRGYYDAYFTDYQVDFETELKDCVGSCNNGNGGCELILAGASQGGANAVVGSMHLYEKYDPIVFTFGAPRVFLPTSPFEEHTPCTSFNKEKQYHFVLTDSFLKAYDPVPSYYAYWTKNVGREILFDGEGNFNDQGVAETFLSRRAPGSQVVHSRTNYQVKTIEAYENACLPTPVSGWVDGHWCSEDSTCQPSSFCSDDGYCTPRSEAGSPCDKNAACLTNFCSSVAKVCLVERSGKSLTSNGASCWRNQDCTSGRCEGYIGFSRCRAPLETGQPCNEHSDCLSSHCAGLLFGSCL
ncbi:expressed unknown protein [Seminavis robusta]|uniref:Fungal lipase-type domain-containing protein n=1 Tax=Seminavis robusta TaxID=568900 RepID=A0A9N8EQF0_9STRA|nr:expressed unknown protein [Seminavis robusta]|eukprot:Sro1508_g278450.1 n/a (609) ;mRNA; f:17808-19634